MIIEVSCIIAIIINVIAIVCSLSGLLSISEQIKRMEINIYKRVKTYFDEKQFNENMKRQLEETKLITGDNMGYYSDLAHNLQRKNERLKKENERLEKEKKEDKEFKKLFICKKGEYVCQSKVSVRPIAHFYGIDIWNGEQYEYYKYSCPICDSLGCNHQVPKGQKNCLICGINLEWELAE